MVIQPQFDYVSSFSEGLAAVAIDKKIGYINKVGKIVIPIQLDRAKDFFEGLAVVKNSDKNNFRFGFINKKGEMVISLSR